MQTYVPQTPIYKYQTFVPQVLPSVRTIKPIPPIVERKPTAMPEKVVENIPRSVVTDEFYRNF